MYDILEEIFPKKSSDEPPEHYYGDIVRRLFLAAGLIMIIGYAFFSGLIQVPIFISLFSVVLISLLAGFQNPANKSIIGINLVVSVVACVLFQDTAITNYLSDANRNTWFFIINEALAIIFFFCIYYSAKTFRSVFLKKG
jgi:hypothetical protein